MQSRSTPFLFLGFLALIVIVSPALADTANQLTEEEKAGGWQLLFDGKTTRGWHGYKKTTFPERGWEIQETWLHGLGKAGGDILSDGQFEEFELEWEWKLAKGGNSGLKYFVLESRVEAIGHEYQMIDEKREPDAKTFGKHGTASFYDVLKPNQLPPTKPAGEVNKSRIIVKGNGVEHWLNGVKVLDYSCSSEAVKLAVGDSKFKNVPGFGTRLKGHILLQEHGTEVWFRNLKIRDLSEKK
jgi:hypothetical protein